MTLSMPLMMLYLKIKFCLYALIAEYLTACRRIPGLRCAGCHVALPALVMTKQINKVLAAISKLSFASRGFMVKAHRHWEFLSNL